MNKDRFTIGVLGTQNTGKSTFIRDIRKRYDGTSNDILQVGTDYREKITEKGLTINRNGSLECQKVIMDTLLEQLDIIGKSPVGKNYIMDRTPIDAYVYTYYLYKHKPELGITPEDIHDMFLKAESSIGKYDILILLDLDKCDNVKVVDDRFRDTNIEYRKEIDRIFKEFIDSTRQKSKGILISDICGDREERIRKFEDKVGKLLI